jgi:putative addiction module killer protein
MIELVVYVTEEGKAPFEDWFAKLDTAVALKVRTALARIETGNLGDVKPVGQGVSERRITFGPGYRVYFGQDGGKLVILLCGGTKKRQSRDIEQAKVFWNDYKNRKQKGD